MVAAAKALGLPNPPGSENNSRTGYESRYDRPGDEDYGSDSLHPDYRSHNRFYYAFMREKVWAPAMAPYGEIVEFWDPEKNYPLASCYDATRGMAFSPLWTENLGARSAMYGLPMLEKGG